MAEEDFGCNENEAEYDDSVVSETCWKENYRGDSRKWLLRDGYPKKSNKRIISTMKATYPFPFQEEDRKYIGERKAILLKKLYDEAAAEIIQERNRPPPVEEYCTEYDGNFNDEYNHIKGNDVKSHEDLKVAEQFPLYTSPAMSYWNFQLEKNRGQKISLPGLTRSVDLKNPFKRNSEFTKPISEVLDECQL